MTRSAEKYSLSNLDLTAEIQRQFEDVRTTEFKNGSVQYSLIGELNPNSNPIVIASGMDNGRINVLQEAALLAGQGKTQVLIAEQPQYNEDVSWRFKANPDNALNFLADAYLAAAQDAGFTEDDRPVNLIGHSLGAPVANRIRHNAKWNNIKSFMPERGSLMALLGAGSSRRHERILTLAARHPRYMLKGIVEAKVLDPTGQNGKTVMKNAFSDLPKSFGEVRALAKAEDRIDYSRLKGTLAVIYPEDHMFPANKEALKGKGIVQEAFDNEYPVPFVTPIEPGRTSVKGIKSYNIRKRRKARLEHALSNNGAGHDEPTNNPKRTVNVIVDFFNHPKNYLGTQR
jgi:hypothetical protein